MENGREVLRATKNPTIPGRVNIYTVHLDILRMIHKSGFTDIFTIQCLSDSSILGIFRKQQRNKGFILENLFGVRFFSHNFQAIHLVLVDVLVYEIRYSQFFLPLKYLLLSKSQKSKQYYHFYILFL